jgi:hypothetical protein
VLADWHREQFVQGVRAEGARITFSKALVESPLLAALGVPARQALGYGQATPLPAGPEGAQKAAPAPAPAPKVRTTLSKAVVQSTVLNALAPALAAPGVPSVTIVPAGPQGPPAIDPLVDPKGAFAQFSARIDDASKHAASVRQLRGPVVPAPGTPPKSPEQIGREAVEADSLVNVRTIRPAVHLWFMAHGAPKQVNEIRDAMYRDLLHVPVDDPYLGLTDALVPGTPPGH